MTLVTGFHHALLEDFGFQPRRGGSNDAPSAWPLCPKYEEEKRKPRANSKRPNQNSSPKKSPIDTPDERTCQEPNPEG
jgi:hypothetical protein